MKRKAENNVNWQERASEFAVGDVVVPFGMFDSQAGRVTAVWPAIGMIDVEMANGNKRYPAEDLQKMDPSATSVPPMTDSAPGEESGTVSVPGGPYPATSVPETYQIKGASRVALAHVKKSLYWAERDRRYKMTRPEIQAGHANCPKCPSVPLKQAVYKRRDGSSEKLLGCPECMFLIKDLDIVNKAAALLLEEADNLIKSAGFGMDENDYFAASKAIREAILEISEIFDETYDSDLINGFYKLLRSYERSSTGHPFKLAGMAVDSDDYFKMLKEVGDFFKKLDRLMDSAYFEGDERDRVEKIISDLSRRYRF